MRIGVGFGVRLGMGFGTGLGLRRRRIGGLSRLTAKIVSIRSSHQEEGVTRRCYLSSEPSATSTEVDMLLVSGV